MQSDTPRNGRIDAVTYAVTAPLLLLSQHAFAAITYALNDRALEPDEWFWLLPVRHLSELDGLSPIGAAAAFAAILAVTWLLALLSFRRSLSTGAPFPLAAATVVPLLQIPAILALIIWRGNSGEQAATETTNKLRVLQGILGGVAVIVLAVLISAVTFGAYGWGLFVLTPLSVGLLTGYLVNRDDPKSGSHTSSMVLVACAFGSLALLMTALEGFVCILLVAPLAALFAVIGGWAGRALALTRHGEKRPLYCISLLPAVFLIEGAAPPSVDIQSSQTIDIAAPAPQVWRAITADEPITQQPTLVGTLGLAYPLRSDLHGKGVGAIRIGTFSTGQAHERVTEWLPNRRLTFVVVSQPPAMEEMSPYRRVHAPHVNGYFETGETRFEIERLEDGGTQLTVNAAHRLRIDPIPYWEPIARWAIADNSKRVLRDIKIRAEAR